MSFSPTSRRAFLKRGASMVALGATVPAFLEQTVLAATKGDRKRRFREDERILVVLQLAGGNDALNLVVPVSDDGYYRARPNLAIAARDTLKLNDDFALHGAATGLKSIHDAGHLGIVHAVGYPNPNRSHFKSMDIWHTASPDGKAHEGWLGRFFDNTCRGADACSPSSGIALMPESPLAMRGERFMPLAFENPDALNWHAAIRPAPTGKVVTALNQPKPIDPAIPETNLEYLRRVALDARLSAEKIQWATRDRNVGGEWPGDVGKSLRTVAQLIGAGMKTRIFYVSHGGFDTHANQLNTQRRLFDDLGKSLMSFFTALKQQGDLDRVLVMSFSEFGRRVAENASGGTDHGAGAAMFLTGAPVKGGMYGTAPDLANLDHGDVRHTTDFRSVYAAVLDDWLGTPSEHILGNAFPKIDLLDRRRR